MSILVVFLMALLYTSRIANQRDKFIVPSHPQPNPTKGQPHAQDTHDTHDTAKPLAQPSLHNWSTIPPEQLNPLLTRQFITGEHAMLARIVLRKGCVVPEHSHPNEQLAFILEGALRFHIAGQTHDVRAGGVLVIPPNVPHSAVALEDTIDFDVFTPPRQDWIDGQDAYLRAPENSNR